ncbi:MAG: hypothetical protein H7A41_06685 [Chlamydiales bacterium]|nr:hypothetical protein [Chlamydiales bacterium]
MEFVTFSDTQHSQVRVKPPSEEKKEEFRQTANTIAAQVLGSGSGVNLMCTETLDEESFAPVAPKVREEVSERELWKLEKSARHYYQYLEGFIQSVKGLMTFVEQRLDETDFSNGYEEETRRSAKLEQMGSLFGTYKTIQESFDQKCDYLDKDGKRPVIKKVLTAWFNAAMGNLSLKILREIAVNNQNSRRRQLIELHQNEGAYRTTEYSALRNYILSQIEALDLEGNPDGWADAALFDLERFLALPRDYLELQRFSPKQQQVVEILRQSMNLLNYYSH